MFFSFSLIVGLSAIFSFINKKFIGWPNTIGVMLLALMMAVIILIADQFSHGLYHFFCKIILDLDFKTLLLDILLSFLLFAGAIHVDISKLRKELGSVISFTTLGVLTSTFLIGGMFYALTQSFGLHLPFIECLLFGALISPTDPIAVLALLKESNVNESLKSQIEGESLFNDGVGVVVFISILGIATAMMGSEVSASEIGFLLLEEAGGGLLFGTLLGVVGWWMIKQILDDAKICVMVTIAIATSGYAIASAIHTSGPLAMVIAGLIIGNKLFHGEGHEKTIEFIDIFWELLDDILNAVLFVLIGLVVLSLNFSMTYIIIGLIAIVLVLLARFASVALPISIFNLEKNQKKMALAVLTWGGLRGGISVALALSIPTVLVSHDVILVSTYMIVIFSIIIQGLTIKKVVTKFS